MRQINTRFDKRHIWFCSSHLAVRPGNWELGIDYEIWNDPILGVIFGPRLFSSSRSLASLTSTSIFITFGNSSIFHTESLEFLAICNLISRLQFGHNDWSYRLPYWSDVTPSDAKPREWTHIWSYTNLRLDGRSLQHGDTLRSWSIHALIICWGRPNRSCNNLIVAS